MEGNERATKSAIEDIWFRGLIEYHSDCSYTVCKSTKSLSDAEMVMHVQHVQLINDLQKQMCADPRLLESTFFRLPRSRAGEFHQTSSVNLQSCQSLQIIRT